MGKSTVSQQIQSDLLDEEDIETVSYFVSQDGLELSMLLLQPSQS